MELTDVSHIESQDVTSFHPQLIIAASGYESRSRYVPQSFQTNGAVKIVLSFKEHRGELARKENDRYFNENGFLSVSCSAKSEPDFKSIFKGNDQQDLRVLFDISVMPRLWIHSLLTFLHRHPGNQRIRLRIVYCPSVYSSPLSLRGNFRLNTISLNGSDTFTGQKPEKTALILGLGTEPGMGLKIYKRLQPEITYLFCAEESIEKPYIESVFINNHELIESIPIRNFIGYDLTDTAMIYKLLVDKILPLRGEYRLAIAINGPKIFSLIAMVLQLTYPDTELIYPSVKHRKFSDKKPLKKLTAIDLEFNAE